MVPPYDSPAPTVMARNSGRTSNHKVRSVDARSAKTTGMNVLGAAYCGAGAGAGVGVGGGCGWGVRVGGGRRYEECAVQRTCPGTRRAYTPT
jgi:hypothetical protein